MLILVGDMLLVEKLEEKDFEGFKRRELKDLFSRLISFSADRLPTSFSQSMSASLARSGPWDTFRQPGSLSMRPVTGSEVRGARVGHFWG